ncbi:MAG TPA: HAD-IA family hydrolase [Gallicola sp.]|nr:HAD-IA family hydrolase [Gallicola sp.]
MKELLTKIRRLNDYDVVLFDIFDTIVTRKVEPEYVKKIWCSFLVKQKEINMTPIELYEKRAQIEKDLCQESKNKGFDVEFKYNDMVKKIFIMLNDEKKIKESFDGFLKDCVRLEVEIESKVQILDNDIVKLIKYLKENNKTVICVSDMYLSRPMIEEIFERLGIMQYIDKIFISQEKLISKRSGRLYDYVFEQMKISPQRTIMIGDNHYSDVEMAKKRGLSAYLIERSKQRENYESFLFNNDEKNIIEKLTKLIGDPKKAAFSNIVFSLYIFTEKLYFKLIEKGAKDVVFFSREGQFLKKIFDNFQETIYNEKIKTHYAIVSRKSTYLPSLKNLKEEKFSNLLNQYSSITLNDFLRSLNLTESDISEIKDSMPNIKNFNKNIVNFSKSKTFSKLKYNKVFQKKYESRRKEQNIAFKKYIDSLSLVDKNNINVVDIGWKGSIQTNIAKILNKTNIYGYYFGINAYNASDFPDREGVIFSNVPQETKNFNLFNENRSLYEILLAADHGSADYYSYDKKTNISEVNTFFKEEELELFEEIVMPIQEEMYELFINIKELLQNKSYNIDKITKMFNRVHYDMLFKPNQEQIDFFNNIYHYENFGVFNFTKFDQKHNYRSKIREYYKFFFKHKIYISDFYWPQLKNYNNGSLLLTKIYALERYLEFKKKNII